MLARQMQQDRLNFEVKRQSYVNSIVGYNPIQPVETINDEDKEHHSRIVMKRAHNLFVHLNLANSVRIPFRACLKKAWREYRVARQEAQRRY